MSQVIAENEGLAGQELVDCLEALKADIFNTLQSTAAIETVVARYCRRRIDRTLKKIDLSNASSVDDIADEYAQKTAALDVPLLANKARDRIQTAIRTRDLPALLAIYDNKGLMALAAKHLKKTRQKDFESWLTRVLRSDRLPALTTALRQHLPKMGAR
jgi:hypothetical protein